MAVDVHLQGRGVGSAMLADFCARMDEQGAVAYLETDKSENVRFYERFAFSVVAESKVLGVPSWFMSRPAPNRADVRSS
jgi:ribosomal protein S18 acetylase RimI-like enzyme